MELPADGPVTCASYTKGNGISHINGWARIKNLAKRDKHDLSCITSPKGEMKSTFSWNSLFKSPTSSTLCFGLLQKCSSTHQVVEVDWGGNLKFNYTSSGSMFMEVDWGGNLKLNYTSSGSMLMEVDWGGKLKHNYTSGRSMHMEVDWGGKLIVNSIMDWGTHDTHPNGHSMSVLTQEVMAPFSTI